MTPQGAKTFAVVATAVGVGIVGVRSAQAKTFNAKALIGVGVWGSVATMVAGFAADFGALLAGLLLADIVVLPTGSGQPSAASILGNLLGGGSSSAKPSAGSSAPSSNPPGTQLNPPGGFGSGPLVPGSPVTGGR